MGPDSEFERGVAHVVIEPDQIDLVVDTGEEKSVDDEVQARLQEGNVEG